VDIKITTSKGIIRKNMLEIKDSISGEKIRILGKIMTRDINQMMRAPRHQ
jgi:hypothetical protein